MYSETEEVDLQSEEIYHKRTNNEKAFQTIASYTKDIIIEKGGFNPNTVTICYLLIDPI